MGRTARRATVGALMAVVLAVGLGSAPAWACAALIGPGGTVRLTRTTTLAAYHDGVEHYLTAFTYQGGGAQFGALIPLPGVPSDLRKGGEWTLQRLEREVNPVEELLAGARQAAATPHADVLFTKRIDALDLTVLRGGGAEVATWAREHGFQLSVDAPEVLDFYAARSPIFMAAVFDARAARTRGQQLGDGTPIQLTIPTANPWVPLRILGLGHQPDERVQADVFLLTDRAPALLPTPTAAGRPGLSLVRSGPASAELLRDLHADKNMGWVPTGGMQLTFLRLDTPAARLGYDLAVDASGRGAPSLEAAGLVGAGSPARDLRVPARHGLPWWPLAAAGTALVVVAGLALIALGSRDR
jgi:Uncharacterized protein conserved in bacteria (DUF2330)